MLHMSQPQILIYLSFDIHLMSINSKIMNITAAQPKLVTFEIGLAIAFVLGTVRGRLDTVQALPLKTGNDALGEQAVPRLGTQEGM
jgi:hypothetical protein